MFKTTKVRIYPTADQRCFLNRQFGAVRFVYNKALFIKRHYFNFHGVTIYPKNDLKPLLSRAKKSRKYAWLKEFDSIALQQACVHLEHAFKAYYNKNNRCRYPAFKRKSGPQTSYHCMSISIGNDWIKIPKINSIKAKIHRKLAGNLKSITVKRTSTGKYFALLVVEQELAAETKTKALNKVVGIDLGLSDIVVESSGNKTKNPKYLKRASENLRRKHKALSRCQTGSKNREKARIKLAKAHEKVANSRADFQHKLSRRLVDENQAIVVETLAVRNMLKHKRLSITIGDAGWYSLIAKLEYKAKEQGKRLVKVDQWFASSKKCSGCGVLNPQLTLGERVWKCSHCQIIHDRDVNAAINIRLQGIELLITEGLSVSAN